MRKIGANQTFLYHAGTIRLAPFYDMISTAVYERQVNNKFAMRMGTQKDPRCLSKGDLEGFSTQIGVGRRMVFMELRRMVTQVERESKRLSDIFLEEPGNRAIITRLGKVIAERCTKARQLLDDKPAVQ